MEEKSEILDIVVKEGSLTIEYLNKNLEVRG